MSPRVAFEAIAPLAFVVVFAAGCASTPPPPTAPEVTTDLRYFSGTALSGRRPDPDAADHLASADSLTVSLRFDFVPVAPDRLGGDPLAANTGLIVSPRAAEPLLGVSRLAAGARIGAGEPPTIEGSLPLGERTAALPAGVTADFFLRPRAPVEGPETELAFAALVAHRTTGVLTLALLLHPDPTGGDAGPGELVELTIRPKVDGDPLWLAVPSPFGGGSIVARLVASTPLIGDAAHKIALAHCFDQLRAQGELERDGLAPLSAAESLERTIDAGLSRIAKPFDLRRSVVFVAEQAHASTLIDLGLACDDDLLRDLAARVQEVVGADASLRRDAGALRFALELIAWRALSERLDSGRIDEAQTGFLMRAAGEVGRFPGAIAAILTDASTAADIEQGLIAENRGFLAASNPASRVRAYDWLELRGLAPADFDPLAARADRKAALEKDEALRAAAPEIGK